MGAFDGYWFPRHTSARREIETIPPKPIKGFYVSWDCIHGGATGLWHDTLDKAEETYASKSRLNPARWYKNKKVEKNNE